MRLMLSLLVWPKMITLSGFYRKTQIEHELHFHESAPEPINLNELKTGSKKFQENLFSFYHIPSKAIGICISCFH